MAFANARTMTIAGGVLAGGVVTGLLLAMAMPTDMKRKTETWRDVIGVREVAVDDGAIPVYAPPQDLTPVEWQTAAQEYPQGSSQSTALDTIYQNADAGYLADEPVEALPPELMRARDADLAALDDDAASSAQAASAAAEDVQQAQESVASDPASTATPTTAGSA